MMGVVTAEPTFPVARHDHSLVPGGRTLYVSRVGATPGPERLGFADTSQVAPQRVAGGWLRRGVWPLLWAAALFASCGAAYAVRDVLFVPAEHQTPRSI